jgi:hypothetical protein
MSEENTARFLVRLWELQAEAGLNNSQLARAIGCDPSYVRHLKAGRKKVIGLRIALGAVNRFPELSLFLLADFPRGQHNVPRSTEGEDTTT